VITFIIMQESIVYDRSFRLFVFLSGFFVCNALVAEFIGVKIFALEETLGLQPFNWNLFGQQGSLSFTCGVILWPIVFIMTDLLNEYYGTKGIRMLSLLTAGLIAYSFIMIFAAIQVAPAGWWVGSNADLGVPDMQSAFAVIFGQSQWIIVGSLTAFLLGQLVDVTVFHWIKKATGEKYLYLRATGSTLVSQFIDSFVVLYIAFVLGKDESHRWPMGLFLAVGTVNYIYKFLAAWAMTPVIYLVHHWIEKYLGPEKAAQMKKEAMMTK
jgi:uncharacterized integral membrane protein (TIGR00697 family)